MSEAATVLDFDIARLCALEQRIAVAESDGLRTRWEFGHALLRARDGKGRLPNGYLVKVINETGASRSEIGARIQFAERFPSEDELSDAIGSFRSWFRIVHDALPSRDGTVDVSEMSPLPEGIYRTICADPPWQYGNTSTRGAAEDHYPTMTVAELCELDVVGLAADESHLYLWTTNGFLREAFDVMDAWGFEYKTTLVWVKPQIGMGNYFRSSTEYVLFGVRGGLRTVDCNQRNWFEAKRTRHSKKPGRFFELVETASSPPYLEMFARERRLNPDWSYWGNEA